MTRWRRFASVWLPLVLTSLLRAQGTTGWTVKPEWVKAHEDFLASDVLAGRGSATRDEQIAATYVASEFESYGLQFPPGMNSYLQTAQVSSASLSGHGVLHAGALTLHEGEDFTLLSSPGSPVSGPLVHVPVDGQKPMASTHGAALLATGVPSTVNSMQTARMLRRIGATLILVSEDDASRTVYTMNGGKTETPVRLLGEKEQRGGPTILVFRPEAFQLLRKVAEKTPVSLEAQAGPKSEVRDTFNAIGYLPGTDPTAGTILLTAHLDHLGTGKPVDGDAIYNGANDDASGTTAVLELAHALAAGPRNRRNLLFVCYGSEELGELGSTYFGQHLPVPLKSLVANLEFEMIGNQDPKMPKGVLLLTGWDRSNLGPELKAHGALLGPDPYPEQHFFERSDNYALALRGVVAHTAAGWGTVPTYHQPNDDLAHLDLPFATAAIQSLIEPVRWLASSDFVPTWVSGGQPKNR